MASKKTTKKAAAPKTAEKKPETTARKFAGRALDLQKNLLERQHSMFDRTYEVVTGLQERQEDAVNKMLERSKYIPEQIADMAELWTGTNRQARKNYKRSVDKSFALVTDWVDGLAKS